MESPIVWITPLLMLPGIATLIISTAARYSTLHAEIHRVLDMQGESQLLSTTHLMTRALHFRNALVAQYVSVFLLVSASLIGALFEVTQMKGDMWVLIVLSVGVAVIAYSTFELIRESRFSLDVIRSHIDQIEREQDKS